MPVPVRAMLAGLFGALLTTEIEPLAAPVVVGVNLALKVPDWPGLRETGRDMVLALKPEPDTLICETVNAAVPLLDNWIAWLLVTPVTTFPKLALPGATVRDGCTPLPVTDTTALGPCEVETVMFPVTFSETMGLNETLNVAL